MVGSPLIVVTDVSRFYSPSTILWTPYFDTGHIAVVVPVRCIGQGCLKFVCRSFGAFYFEAIVHGSFSFWLGDNASDWNQGEGGRTDICNSTYFYC